MEQITNSQLREFFLWRKQRIKRPNTFMAGLSASMAAYFHIHPKDASELIGRCEQLGFITRKTDYIKINLYYEAT